MKLCALKVYNLNFMGFEAFCTRWKEYYTIKIDTLQAWSFHISSIIGKARVKTKIISEHDL